MTQLKSFLKQLFPPFMLKLFRLAIGHKQEVKNVIKPIWQGNYQSWNEAIKNTSGYEASQILEQCKNALLKVKNGEAVYERDSVIFNEVHFNYGLLAALLKAANENNGELIVIDFGGSLGSSYFQNRNFLNPIKKLKWCIVEQKHFVDCGNQFFADENLEFYYSIEACLVKNKPNVLLISGVIQYLEKPYEWLQKFVDFQIPYIIIDRLSLVRSGEDVLTVQNVPDEIYKASYPAWFFNKDKFEKILFNHYNLIAYFDSGFTPPATINENNKVYWNGLILKK